MRSVFVPLVACFLTVLPGAKAQDCSSWSNWDLRGTYALSGSGYIDLSRAFPGQNLPSGLSPYYWVGAQSLDGNGGGTGWISINFGGNQLTAEFVDYAYSMQPDCSVLVSYRLKYKELGTMSGPQRRINIIVPKPNGGLELDSLSVGTDFGTPAAPVLSLDVKRRISME
jgi:hypothetical protein